MAYIQAHNGYIFTIMNCVTMDPKKWIYSMVLKINLDKKTEIWLDSWFIQVEPPVLRFLLDWLRVKFPIVLAGPI